GGSRWRRSAMVRVMMNGGSPRLPANRLRMMKSDGGLVFQDGNGRRSELRFEGDSLSCSSVSTEAGWRVGVGEDDDGKRGSRRGWVMENRGG
ncbi:hypothetical protein Dimus_035530, partial [Dionaea muscipula]